MLRLCTLLLAVVLMSSALAAPRTAADEPLLDWSAWKQYRATVVHPATIVKPGDLARARENQQRYDWARRYVAGVRATADSSLARLTPQWLEQFIPVETPGDSLFTPCPACRDLKKPAHPHGQYRWSAEAPETLTCQVCGTVYPSEKYPESLVYTTRYGGGQKLSFYGGPGFDVFGFVVRPSFTANIRARKVGVATEVCRQLAEAYALTGEAKYAAGARQLLLRFAQVYPGWLVHVGYGEYADLDPHLAALNMSSLPEDEITPTPGGPDRRLHSGYWQGGRATGTGMEAGFVRRMCEAYSFVCQAAAAGQPLFTEQERLQIERDLLLESTVLLVADKAVNNKSVGNATAVALVGMVTGHPEMVRFGLDVFNKTVDGWFLGDGGTSESYSYATMTLSGIEALGQAFRGYSDPPGYRDGQGKRLDGLDLYHDTAYRRVWEAMFNGLQGDLNYPPLADGHRTSSLGSHFAELMADNYPDNPQYVALLKSFAGAKLAGGDVHTAIYCRPPGLEERDDTPLSLPDYVFPVLQFGYLRSGETGRDSCLVLSASDWGGHHHHDSLGLYYWQRLPAGAARGQELLSDLGYLWDHPQARMTNRTFAHNTVIVDGAEQRTTGRGGKFTLFNPAGAIKVMEAESEAYAQTTLYRRTVVQVEHQPGRQYVLDLFRVQGGKTHDYVLHGLSNKLTAQTPPLAPLAAQSVPLHFCVRLPLGRPGDELQVADVSVTGPDGRELAAQAAPTTDRTKLPAGFGAYQGDGTQESGQAPGRNGGSAAYMKALAPGTQLLNVALIVGDSDGYSGAKAYAGRTETPYQVSFWVRGTAKGVRPSALYWLGEQTGQEARQYATLEGLPVLTATADWTRYSGTLLVSDNTLDLDNQRSSTAAAPWRLMWDLGEGQQFAALWPNEQGYSSLLGDGWGQRDYLNTDVAATLPYVVRRHVAAGDTRSVFVTAFEGCRAGEALVQKVERLPVPAAEADNTVALAVSCVDGTDYVVSSLAARPLALPTADGLLEVNARFAAVSVRGGKLVAANLTEGLALRLGGRTVGQ